MSLQTAPISNLLIVGFGVMGQGIARLFAGAGMNVTGMDPKVSAVADLPDNVRLVAALPAEAPDLVIEAAPEDLDIKAAVFRELEAAYGEGPILATNTSGLPLEDIAKTMAHPERFIGMHFFTPAEVSPLIEVVRVAATRDDVMTRAVAAVEATGREAIQLSRPIVGYLWNRLQHAILHEAYYMVGEGIVSPEAVDKVAKQLLGPRWCVTGLLEGKDIFNLEPNIRAQHSIVPHLNLSHEVTPIVKRKLERREFGLSTGKGFYDWTGCDTAEVAASARRKLRRLLTFLETDMVEGEPDVSPAGVVPPK